VILDVHENSGGLNPYLFASWFAQGPTTHPRLVTRVAPELPRAQVSSMFFSDDTSGYEAAQKRGDRFYESFFLCPHGRCEVDPPATSELVTKAPVALLVGPECRSTCDTLAFLWSNERLGPVVGRAPGASYTVHRHKIRVGELAAKAGLPSEDLGTFTVAMSASYVRGKPLEGEPIALDWTAPDTFETRASWVSASAREAIRLLRARNRAGSAPSVK
jgi:hypothetical protein